MLSHNGEHIIFTRSQDQTVALNQERKFFMASYSEEQKRSIMEMPAAVLLSAIVADAGSTVVGMREFIAGEKFFSEASTRYPGNALIQEMVKEVRLPELEKIVQPVLSLGNLDGIRAECQKKISTGLIILAHDQEAEQFKMFLVALADKVVNAAGEGFFGNRGTRMSANETAYMNQLKQQLHITSTPMA
jgi:hypothetical protein